LLILDGYGSHITYEFVNYCESHDIILYCLPPHSTHLLQPLNVGLFAPLQHSYSKAVEDYFLTTNVTINRDTFYPLFKKARQQAYTTKNIKNSFYACSIVPLQSKIVLDKLQAPKITPTEV
ncbi:DDE-domain-containing protein, partial [Wilcoxina mikolae CBS 423.85]